MATRAQIIAEARTWIGVRWRHQGRTRRGVDCVGLVVLTGRACGLPIEDFTAYQRHAHGHALLDPFDAQGVAVQLSAARPGDVIIFVDRHYPCHVGILSEKAGVMAVVHAMADYGKVWETPYAGEWQRNARFAYAFPGLED
jgi:cell wall-associated NlpC family hydrolase